MRKWSNYDRAVRYATKLIRDYNAPYTPRDLVHDSYLGWNKYKDSDLFDNPEGVIMKVVKNTHFTNINSEYIQKGSREDVKNKLEERIKRIYIPVVATPEATKDDGDDLCFYVPKDEKTPIDHLLSQEYEDNLNNSLCDFDKNVLNLKLEGYQNNEIEKILDTHNVKITKSVKNIKEKMHTNSPFAGSKLKITKRIKRRDFEKNKDKYLEEYEMGDLSDYNEYYVQMTSKSIPTEGILIKEKDSD